MITLKEAAETVQNQIKSKKLSYRYIGRVAQNSDKEDLLKWLIKYDFFDRHIFVLMGVHNSNKWPLLKDELPQYYIQKKNPYGFAICYDLIEKDPDIKDFLKIAPTFDDRLSIYSWVIRQLESFPYSPASVLQYTNMEELFELKFNRFSFYERVALPKMQFITGKREKSSEKYDYRSVNLGALLILLHSLSSLLKSDIQEVDNFRKFLIMSGFSKYNQISKTKLDSRFSKWAQLEESIIHKYRNQLFSDRIPSFKSQNYSPLFQFSDFQLIEKYAKSNFYDSVTAFRILQLRLHYDRSLDLSYEEISQFSLLKDYINELAFIGIIESERYSEMFKWPKIGEVSNFDYKTLDRFDEYNPESLLKKIDYTVGKNGLTTKNRQTLLTNFFEGRSEVEKLAVLEWGTPNSSERLEKMAFFLVLQIRNHQKIGNEIAVSHWKEDLEFLKDKYYDVRRFKFDYPDV